uniref:Uncharacterized protein n=1 Tax=Peronospora matthiolae TaxID=2874970 RepID=A0AAV1VIK9_9STRA
MNSNRSQNLGLIVDKVGGVVMKANVISLHPNTAKDDRPNHMENDEEAVAVTRF